MKALLPLVVVGLVSGMALAGPVSGSWYMTKGSEVYNNTTDSHLNSDTNWRARISGDATEQAGQGILVAFDNTTIKNWLMAQMPAYGFTADQAGLKQAVLSGAAVVSVQVFSKPGFGPYTNALYFATVWSNNDWANGNVDNRGDDYATTNYQWAGGTTWTIPVPTQANAVDTAPDSTGAVPWVDPTTGLNAQFSQLPGQVNSTSLSGLISSSGSTYALNTLALDPKVAWDLLYSEQLDNSGNVLTSYPCVGLRAYGTTGAIDNASIAWVNQNSSHGTGPYRPELMAVVDVPVPEPATMGLLLVGGIGALLRRRK